MPPGEFEVGRSTEADSHSTPARSTHTPVAHAPAAARLAAALSFDAKLIHRCLVDAAARFQAVIGLVLFQSFSSHFAHVPVDFQVRAVLVERPLHGFDAGRMTVRLLLRLRVA